MMSTATETTAIYVAKVRIQNLLVCARYLYNTTRTVEEKAYAKGLVDGLKATLTSLVTVPD
jgi:hypothetical protein